MRQELIALLVAVPLVVLMPVPSTAGAGLPQAQPREQGPSRGSADPRTAPADPQPAQGRAQPRPPSPPAPRAGQGRRPTNPPPPRVVPPTYYRTPRPYYFPPIQVQRGFYYHPYFGFYFGPYYGPYYPYPGPSLGPARYTAAALRTRVRPLETQVYVNGYYAGVADDFDGIFQRLYLPAGGHEIEFRLEGYRSFAQKLYLQPGDTQEIAHQMQPAPGGNTEIPVPYGALPPEWRDGGAATVGDRPASPFGILALRVEPDDAEVVIDGEPWLGTENLAELVLHVPAGWHVIEVRKAGYQTFRAEVELTEGVTTRLNLRLTR